MRNILLIVVDTLRPDHLGCYGYHRDTTPQLDRLAAQGVVLDNLWSASNFTAPAFTSLFSGKYPYDHGVFDFTSRIESSGIYDVMQANQVTMGGVVTFRFFKNLLKSIWGEIEAVTDTRSFDYSKDLPIAVTDSALAWLKDHRGAKPFSLFVHYDGPHMPYRLPVEHAHRFDAADPANVDLEVVRNLFPQDFERLPEAGESFSRSMFGMLEAVNWGRKKLDPNTLQFIRDKYDASIYYNDLAIGKLLEGLETLGLEEDTVVCVLSDHGEEFLEHGGISHSGINLHEEVIRTVGIIKDPGKTRPGSRMATPLSHVDIWPALLELAGATEIAPCLEAAGFPASPDRALDKIPRERPVFCQGKAKIAVRSGDNKLVKASPSPTLGRVARGRLWGKMLLQRKLGTRVFNLANDPQELQDLSGNRQLKNALLGVLAAGWAGQGEVAALGVDLADAERKRIEKEMKDLGYM